MNHNFLWMKAPELEISYDQQIQFLQVNRKTTSITWIGHSTFLIQFGGLNILTDPVWTSFMSLKRRISIPGIHLDNMPAIDVVLISHGQHLRLHFQTFRQIKGDPLYLVPDGMQATFIVKDFKNVKEVSWWNHFVKLPLQFIFVPSYQGARKSVFDVRRCSSGGWICHNPKTSEHLYFSGDTGYFPGFAEIGKKYPIDFAMIPIGPYKPQWFGSISPITFEDAVQAFLDLHANTMIPTQYGTFAFSDSECKVRNRLREEWNKRGLLEEKLRLFKIGETWTEEKGLLSSNKKEGAVFNEP